MFSNNWKFKKMLITESTTPLIASPAYAASLTVQ